MNSTENTAVFPLPAEKTRLAQGGPIDMKHLCHYTMGDVDLAQEVLNLFRVQARLYVEALQKPGSQDDWKLAAHTLKGSAQGIGADRLAECARACEQIVNGQSSAPWDEAVAGMTAAFQEVDDFIQGKPPAT
ncbi:MAG: Hpt domain-containing protein [Pseudomonadota bacterium]